MQAGPFKRIGVLMILDTSSLASRERLLKVNLTLLTMWACTAVVIKPWTSRTKIDRQDNGTMPTEMIPDIAEEINMVVSKIEKLLRSPNKFLAIHASGVVVAQGPATENSKRRHRGKSTASYAPSWSPNLKRKKKKLKYFHQFNFLKFIVKQTVITIIFFASSFFYLSKKKRFLGIPIRYDMVYVLLTMKVIIVMIFVFFRIL